MENLVEFCENENKGWSVHGHKPDDLDERIWSGAIEYEVLSEWFDFFNLEKLNRKARKNFDRQKTIILKSLKAIFFDICPKAAFDQSGQIYLFYPYSEYSVFIHTLANGELGFVGNGTVCILTPQNENSLCVSYYNLNHNFRITKEISMAKMDDAIKNDYLIKMEKVTI